MEASSMGCDRIGGISGGMSAAFAAVAARTANPAIAAAFTLIMTSPSRRAEPPAVPLKLRMRAEWQAKLKRRLTLLFYRVS
jgi:hypothetical protein